MAIDYVCEENEIKHYLVPEKGPKLQDLIKDKYSLKFLLVCNSIFSLDSVDQLLKEILPKDNAFSVYYTKINQPKEKTDNKGYVPTLN